MGLCKFRPDPAAIQALKVSGKKIVMLTAYDARTSELLDKADVDIILVGDSLGNVILGYPNTIPVTMDDMVHHTAAVCRSVTATLVVADMPFMSYQVSRKKAKSNAARLIQHGAHAVKCEVNASNQIDYIRDIVSSGIPVMGHLGVTPQSINQLGGYRLQGKDTTSADQLIALAVALEQAGAFAIVLEMVVPELANTISQTIQIPTIGIGSGPHCDGFVLVIDDVLGWTVEPPKFVRQYAQFSSLAQAAVARFCQDIHEGKFP